MDAASCSGVLIWPYCSRDELDQDGEFPGVDVDLGERRIRLGNFCAFVDKFGGVVGDVADTDHGLVTENAVEVDGRTT